MSQSNFLRGSFVALEVNGDFSEAALAMSDGSRLHFCHRVGQRWARAEGSDGKEQPDSLAAQVLAGVAHFRLNGKHLDILFSDGSRWEAPFRG